MLTFKRQKDMFFSEAQRVPPLNNWNCALPFLAPEVLPPLLIMLFFSFSLSPELIQVENTKQKSKYKYRSTRFLHNATFLNLPSRRSCNPLMENGKWTKNAPISENFPHYQRPPAFLLSPLSIFPSSSTAVEIQSRALAVGPSYPLQHFQTLSENHLCKSVLQRMAFTQLWKG